MGCNASTEKTSDPVLSKNGVSFSSLRSKNIKKKPLSANNRIHPGSTDNNSNSNGGPVANGKRAMRGDLSLYHDAKYKRNNYLRARHRTRENKAQEISDRAIEDSDRFSLVSLSRTTSRATSPRQGRHAPIRPNLTPSPEQDEASTSQLEVPSTSQSSRRKMTPETITEVKGQSPPPAKRKSPPDI